MASGAVAVAALDSDSVVVGCGIIRRLVMLLVGWGSLSAEKKARWRGDWVACADLLWKPSAGWRTGEVELPDKNSGASWNEVIGRSKMKMLREQLESETACFREIYACQALLG
jgi:hypothetical protein